MFPNCDEFWSWNFGGCEISNNQALIFEALFALGLGFLFLWLQRRQSRKLEKVTKDVTEKIYLKPIKRYQCDFNIDDPDGTHQSANQKAQMWATTISNDITSQFGGVPVIQIENDTRKITISTPNDGDLEIQVKPPSRTAYD